MGKIYSAACGIAAVGRTVAECYLVCQVPARIIGMVHFQGKGDIRIFHAGVKAGGDAQVFYEIGPYACITGHSNGDRIIRTCSCCAA